MKSLIVSQEEEKYCSIMFVHVQFELDGNQENSKMQFTFSRKTGMASTTTADERGRASIM